MFSIQPIYIEFAVLILGILLIFLEAFSGGGDKRGFAYGAIAGLAVIFVLTFFTGPTSAAVEGGVGTAAFYQHDFLALFFKRFALLSTMLMLVMAIDFRETLARFTNGGGSSAGVAEFFALPVLACAGVMWMVSAVDFVMIFVSLELLSIASYVLVGYMRRSAQSLEAGVKYLILSALSTGFLVYGITWVFGVTGYTNLVDITRVVSAGSVSETHLLFGIAFILIALGFKVAAVPFQIWVPDVYQGAPTPVTAYLSVASKAAGFVVLIRVVDIFSGNAELQGRILLVIAGMAGLTLLYGNLAALPQTNLKRLLAYSSIAHAGYLLIGVTCVSGAAVVYYLTGYLFMTMLAFMVMVVVSAHTGSDEIRDYRGLARRSPFLAFAMLMAMLSLAGLPFTAGFMGKFLIFAAAIEAKLWVLVGVGTVAVVCGFYYYLKVVKAMYWQTGEVSTPISVSGITKFFMSLLIAAILVFGIFPQPILDLLR